MARQNAERQVSTSFLQPSRHTQPFDLRRNRAMMRFRAPNGLPQDNPQVALEKQILAPTGSRCSTPHDQKAWLNVDKDRRGRRAYRKPNHHRE